VRVRFGGAAPGEVGGHAVVASAAKGTSRLAALRLAHHLTLASHIRDLPNPDLLHEPYGLSVCHISSELLRSARRCLWRSLIDGGGRR